MLVVRRQRLPVLAVGLVAARVELGQYVVLVRFVLPLLAQHPAHDVLPCARRQRDQVLVGLALRVACRHAAALEPVPVVVVDVAELHEQRVL